MARISCPAGIQPRQLAERQAPSDGDRGLPKRVVPMMRICVAAALRNRLKFFTRDKRGVSAIEFALLAPVMLTLYLGGVETGDAIAISRKVTIATRTVANLTTLYSAVTSDSLNGIMSVASIVAAPYPL